MRGRGPCALGEAPGLDYQHWLVACGGSRGRDEFAGVRDRLDVEQNGSRRRLAAEVVEHVAEVDIGGIAERHEV